MGGKQIAVGVPVNNLERFAQDSDGQYFAPRERSLLGRVVVALCFPLRVLTCRSENRPMVREWIGSILFVVGGALFLVGLICMGTRSTPRESWSAVMAIGVFVGWFGLALTGSAPICIPCML
jgi:protein-S-isoprenylcysteine O-methyltransferase Ste14